AGRLDADADARSLPEDVRHREESDAHSGELAGRQRARLPLEVRGPRLEDARRLLVELPVAGAQPTVLDVVFEAVGTDLAQRDLDVGVGRAGADPQVHASR